MFSVSLLALNLVLQITVLEPVLCIQSAEFSDAAKSTGSTSERRVEGPDQLLPTSDNQAAKPAGKPAELYSTVPGEDCSDPTARAVSAGQDNKCDAPMPPQSPPAPLSNRVRSELTFVNETVDGLGTPVSPYIAAETNELLFKLVFSYVGNGLPAVVGDFEASDIEVTSKSGLVRGEHFEVEIQPPLETWELAYAAVLLRAVGRWPNCDNHDQPVKVSLRRFSVHPPSLEVVEVMPSTSLYILWMPGQEHEAGCEGTSPTQTPAEPPPQLPPWHAAPKLSRQAPAESPPTPGMPFPLAAPPEPAEAPIQTPPQTPAETPPSSPSLAPLAPAEARVDAPSPLSAPVAADAPLPQPPLVLAPVDPADLGARVQEAPEPPSPGPSASSEGNSAISTGVIAAVAVGGAAVLAGAAVAALFLLRRKRARQTVAVSSAPAGGGEGQPLVESKTAADSAARSEAEEASEDEGEGAGNADEEAESSEREEEKEDGQG